MDRAQYQATETIMMGKAQSAAPRSSAPDRQDVRRRQVARERKVLLPLLAGTLLLIPNFGRVKVTGRSMEPSFKNGQSVALLKSYRVFSPLKEGDVIVIQKKEGELAGEDLIKRIAFIQNAEGNKPWPAKLHTVDGDMPSHYLFPAETLGMTKVPPGTIYVLGDNLPVSTDSRDSAVGAITDEEIIGKVVFAH